MKILFLFSILIGIYSDGWSAGFYGASTLALFHAEEKFFYSFFVKFICYLCRYLFIV